MNMVQFRRELQKIQRQGYALDDEEPCPVPVASALLYWIPEARLWAQSAFLVLSPESALVRSQLWPMRLPAPLAQSLWRWDSMRV
jgi:hypothetical protein